MQLRSLKLGKCKIEISSSNDKKPKVKVENETLIVEPFCVCGASCGIYEIDDHTSKIIENALIEKKIAEEHGKPLRVQMDDFSSIHTACSECGREIDISIHHVLDEAWLNDLNYKRMHGKESMVYGGSLEILVEVEGGHFAETRSPRQLSELINPICACGTQMAPIKLRNAAETIINEIDRFWKDSTEVKPKTVEITEKCRFCLHDIKIKAEFVPLLPYAPKHVVDGREQFMQTHELVEQYESWKNRFKT